MQLKELLSHVPSVQVEGSLDRPVTGLAYDSRRVTPGVVFVAIPGKNVDGHEYIGTAIERGAVAIICERNGFGAHRAAKVRVADARQALAQAAEAFYDRPGSKLKMVGVTGTNGKTTVSFLVKQILELAGWSTGLIGTVRYEIGERVIPAHRTTPEALEVQQMLSHMVRAGCRACVMEVSSHALDQHRVSGVDFDTAIFTNLTQDHLDYHGSMENYFSAKQRLFMRGTGDLKQRGAVVNVDDTFGGRLMSSSDLPVRLGFGLQPTAQVRASKVELQPGGSHFLLETPQGSMEMTLPLIGRHNIYNALAAAGAAVMLGIDLGTITRALASALPVPGRLERVDAGQPFGVFVDYAHTDDALRNVLATLREITRGRLLVAFGCGGSRDSGKRARMGAVAAELADATWITNDNPRRERPEEIASQIEEGFRGAARPGASLVVELDRRRAIEEIIRAAKPGDMVIIAGKGHETYQEFESTVIPFDDRIYAQETLEALGYRGGEQ